MTFPTLQKFLEEVEHDEDDMNETIYNFFMENAILDFTATLTTDSTCESWGDDEAEYRQDTKPEKLWKDMLNCQITHLKREALDKMPDEVILKHLDEKTAKELKRLLTYQAAVKL